MLTKDLSEPLSSVYGSGGYAFSRYNPALKFGTPLTPAQESRTTLAQVGTRNAAAAPASCIASAPTRATLRTLHRASCVLSSRRLPRRRPCGRPVPYLCYRYSPPPHTLQVAAPVPVHWSPRPCALLPQVSVGGLNDPSACYVYLMPPPGAAPAPVSRPSLAERDARLAMPKTLPCTPKTRSPCMPHSPGQPLAVRIPWEPCVSRACQACAVCGAVHWCSALEGHVVLHALSTGTG